MTRPAVVDLLDQRGRERLAGRLALGVGRDDLERERLAVEIDVAGRAQADLEAADRQHDRRRGGHVVLGQPGGESQRLLLGESLGGELDMILAGRVGRAVEDAAVGKVDLDRPARHRRAVLVARDQVGLDRLAAIVDGLLQVEAQVDRLELVRLDLETCRRSRSCPAGRPGRDRCPPARPNRAPATRETCRIPRA